MILKPENFIIDQLPKSYLEDVKADIEELKDHYKFVDLVSPPLAKPYLTYLKVIAVNTEFIERTCGLKEDFIGEYSKEIIVVVPLDYKKKGCYVYGAKWVDIEKIPKRHRHFFLKNTTEDGYKHICVGVPASHANMRNPILEDVRTAEHILVGYELYMSGAEKNIDLIEYSHGDTGIKEYEQNEKKYRTK